MYCSHTFASFLPANNNIIHWKENPPRETWASRYILKCLKHIFCAERISKIFHFPNSNKKLCFHFQSDQKKKKIWSINVKTSIAICVHRGIRYKHLALAAMVRTFAVASIYSYHLVFSPFIFANSPFNVFGFLFLVVLPRASLIARFMTTSSIIFLSNFPVEKFLIEKLMLWRDIRGLKSTCGNWKITDKYCSYSLKNPIKISFPFHSAHCDAIEIHPSQKLLHFD